MIRKILHIIGIHDWVPRYVIRDRPIDKSRMVRLGKICTVCGLER
jgi:hypothetical protein